MQIRPFDMVERELRLLHLEFERADVDIQCSIKVFAEIESA
jgi:hypothetical protein